jgi:hypothetical protein
VLKTSGEAAFDYILARPRSIGGSRALVRTIAEAWPSVDRGRIAEREVLINVLQRPSRWGAVIDSGSLDGHALQRQLQEATLKSAALLHARAQDVGLRHASV